MKGVVMMREMRLGTKLMIGGLAAVAIPIIIIGMAAVYESTVTIFSLAEEGMVNTSRGLAYTLNLELTKELRLTQNISFSNNVIAAAEKVDREGEKNSRKEIDQVQKELAKIRKTAGDRYSSVLLVRKDGITFADGDEGKFKGLNLAGRAYLEKALQGAANIGEMVHSRKDNNVICTSAAPIYAPEGNRVVGVVVVTLRLSYFWDLIDTVKIGRTGYVFLVDQNGIYIAHPVKEKILKEGLPQTKGYEALVEKIKGTQAGVVEYISVQGIKNIAAFAQIELTGWRIFTTIPSEELLAPAHFTRNIIMMIGLIALLAASAFFYFFARGLARPLSVLVDAAEKIAVGDLGMDIPVMKRQDEVGVLAGAFMRMSEYLTEKAQVVNRIAAGDLSGQFKAISERDALGNAAVAMVEGLRRITGDIKEGINVIVASSREISVAATQLASSSVEAATAVRETTTTIEEVKQTARLVSERAGSVSEVTRNAEQVSQGGKKSVEDSISIMIRISDQVESIAASIGKLSEQSQAIGGIITTVNDLAGQSNLLAVNAAIEAAKAGEQGKGFAVVAQEVKSLAEQSKQATEQVRLILSDIQKAISAGVMATEQGSKAAEAGVHQSSEAGEAIRLLAENVAQSARASVQIAASTNEQLAGMDQVAQAMENIRQASEQNVASTRQAETAAKDLQELGQKLKTLVDRYQL
ncbi:MAG: methyl-accepting chemotaxis protein [Syntrophales bacterium]|nr:methyl-accepting chemotaxis protein [Syntrophales bacterium]